jgi:hypothetical protein
MREMVTEDEAQLWVLQRVLSRSVAREREELRGGEADLTGVYPDTDIKDKQAASL